MDTSRGVLLGAPPETRKRPLDIPQTWTPEDDDLLTDWSERFRREQERVDRMRFRNSSQNWVGLQNVASQYVSGTAFTGTAITDISPAPDFTLPAGVPGGTVLRLNAWGQFVGGGSVTTLTLQFMYGGTGGTSLFTTGAVTVSVSTTQNWHLEAYVRIVTPGTSGTAVVFGRQQGVSTTANYGVPVMIGSTSVSLNTTTANTIIVAATAGVAFTSVTNYIFTVEQLN